LFIYLYLRISAKRSTPTFVKGAARAASGGFYSSHHFKNPPAHALHALPPFLKWENGSLRSHKEKRK